MLDLAQAKQEIAQAPPNSGERLALLLARSLEFYRNHPLEARKWAEEARKIAKKLKRVEDEARALVRLGSVSFQVSQFDRAEKELRAALKLFDAENGPRGSALLCLGLVMQETGERKAALALFEEALEAFKDDPSKQIGVLTEMGNALREKAEYANALEVQYRALAILDLHENLLKRSIVLSNIAVIYQDVHDLERAASFWERSAILKKESGDISGLATVMYNRGVIAREKGNFEEARAYYQRTLQLAGSVGLPDFEVYVSDSLGQIELEEHHYAAARKLFERAQEISKSLNLRSIQCSSLIGLGRSEIALDHTKKGLTHLQVALRLSEEAEMPELICESCSALAKGFERSGNLKEAVKYFNRFIELNDVLHSQQRQRALVEIQARIEIEKADRERARMELLAKDATERANILKSETERQSQQLTALALQLVEKNEFLCNLREDLESDAKRSRKSKAMVERIDTHIHSDRDWETFEHQFNQVHRDFLSKLAAAYPALTPTEMKIAVLIKLNLTSKAIANLLCLSARTVENHRQSIRRKLKLHADDNLVSFLTSFGEGR